MEPSVSIQVVSPRILAAVTRKVAIGEVGTAWRPALDKVWAFLREHPGLRTDGHNIFLYHHPARRTDPMDVDFGVQIVREFEPSGEVHSARTPAGEVATATHVGPYDRIAQTHEAIHAWAAANHRKIGDLSWEIYGDPTEDPSQIETTIFYLLR